MKKFILSYKLSPQFYSTGTPDDLLETLGRMKSEGTNLDDYSVMVINTEKYPSMTKSAREFLRDLGKQILYSYFVDVAIAIQANDKYGQEYATTLLNPEFVEDDLDLINNFQVNSSAYHSYSTASRAGAPL